MPVLGADTHKAIQCDATGKLLARLDTQGVYLFCKLCHKEHLFTWEALQKLASLQENEGR